MQLTFLLARFQRSLALFALSLVTLATLPVARAITNDELLPANLVGKTLTCTYNAGTPNTLEPTTNFTIQFTSATTYVRTSPLVQTEGGTYTVLDSNIAANTGGRVNTIQINNNWLSAGSTTAILFVLTQSGGNGVYTASEFFNPLKNTGGTFTLSGGSTGGGTTGVPVITGPTTLNAPLGQAYSYKIPTTPAATRYDIIVTDGRLGIGLANLTGTITGSINGSFNVAGTFTFGITATNAAGTSPITTFTLIVGTPAAAPVITSAATATANVGSAYSYQIAATNTPTSYAATGLPNGLTTNASTGLITGTPTAAGTFTVNITATNATGSTTGRLTLTVGTAVVSTVTAAPTNLVGYRNKVGGVYQFTVTGVARGAVWGTDVYTDDSTVAVAAVHAGVLAAGETKTVTVTILPGQASYAATTRNGVSSSSWGSWSGSYSFAGAGAVTGVSVATAAPAAAPGFVAGTAALATGGRLVCPVNVSGGGTYSYRWYLNGVLIAGATANPYIVDSLTAANAGTYAADVTNALGTTRISAGTVSVGASGSPVFALQPISKTVLPGATFTLATNATGSGLSYQWFRNNVALPGETGAILLRNNANAPDAGAYTVRISNSSGTVTSSAATVTLSANASRPANISVRTNVATGTLVTPGFVLQGTGSKRVLIRAVGPGLAAFGLAGTMSDPKFTVYQGSTIIATNDDWSAANIGQAFTATGAFALPAGSKDAALVTDLAAGKDYTVQVTNASGTGGIVLVEVYDADALKGTSSSKLVNVSVRGQTAPGDDVLTLGLVIGGTGPRTLLVRGIGPKLAAFGVTGTVPDPRLQIFDSQSRAILGNDDWANADFVTELALASEYVGAFALDAGSKDAATLSLVDPGSYTIQVSGTTAAPTGEALVEVYEVP